METLKPIAYFLGAVAVFSMIVGGAIAIAALAIIGGAVLSVITLVLFISSILRGLCESPPEK